MHDEGPLPPRARPTTMEWFNEGIAAEAAAEAARAKGTEHYDDEPPRRRRRIGGTIAVVLALTVVGLLVRSRFTAAAAPLPQPAMAPVAAPVVPAAPLNRSL
jgi:hypothetical protein